METINKVIATVRRPNGEIETVDMTAKLPSMTEQLFRRVKEANRAAGRGEVLKIEHSYTTSNCAELEREYVDGMLEGGFGYVPDMTKDPRFRTWVHTEVYA